MSIDTFTGHSATYEVARCGNVRYTVEVTLEPVRDGERRLSFTGTAKRGRTVEQGGQIQGVLADVASLSDASPSMPRLVEWLDGWTPERLLRLVHVWKRWHLNDMRAACEHQREFGWTSDEHMSQPCPVCGYKLGHAWRYEPLTPGVVEYVMAGCP